MRLQGELGKRGDRGQGLPMHLHKLCRADAVINTHTKARTGTPAAERDSIAEKAVVAVALATRTSAGLDAMMVTAFERVKVDQRA